MNLSCLVPRPDFLPAFDHWHLLRTLRIAETGHRGTLGALATSRLRKNGIDVQTYPGDICDESKLSNWIEHARPDLLLHFAAIVPVQKVLADPVAAMRVNAISNLALIELLARFAPNCWLFYSSTSHVYAAAESNVGRPISESHPCQPSTLYGATKFAGERVLLPIADHYQVRTCVGRIFSYFHEQQSPMFLIPSLVERLAQTKSGGTLTVRDSDSVRDLLHAEMVIDAILHLCAARHAGIVNIGSGCGRSVGSVADKIVQMSGRDITVEHLPSHTRTALVADVGLLKAAIPPSRSM